MTRTILAAMAAALLTGCSLVPEYHRPDLPVAPTFPDVPPASASAPGTEAGTSADKLGWRSFFADPKLQELIATALRNNRDLRIAVLNVETSEAQFRSQRADLFPHINLTGSGTIEKIPRTESVVPGLASSGGSSISRDYTSGIGFTSYELDLFGRERSLTEEAFETYLATAETRRSSQLTLVGEVASGYFTLLADQALLKLSRETLDSQIKSYDLTKAMFDHDTATLLALRQAESTIDSAKANVAQYARQVALDQDALVLLLGEPMPQDLPPGRTIDDQGLLADLPAGLPSDLLTHRPDIMAAEHTLLAANADIGAARAAFFPSITLTASGGTASSKLSHLFVGGAVNWSFAPQLNLPIFTAGQNQANLDVAKTEKNIDVAKYEQTIQTAFREVSDALAASGTYRDQQSAEEALVAADADSYRLSEMRFRAGIDNYLTVLESEQSLYAAQQTLVSVKEAKLGNLVSLYKALGGGWNEQTILMAR